MVTLVVDYGSLLIWSLTCIYHQCHAATSADFDSTHGATCGFLRTVEHSQLLVRVSLPSERTWGIGGLIYVSSSTTCDHLSISSYTWDVFESRISAVHYTAQQSAFLVPVIDLWLPSCRMSCRFFCSRCCRCGRAWS